MLPNLRLLLYATVALLAAPGVASAALGESVASVEPERARVHGTLRAIPTLQYTLHEITGADGTRIREFENAAGVVFALSWSGPFKPDLQQLLGAHFAAFNSLPRGAESTRNAMQVATPQFVAQSSGHGRAFYGRAYLPEQVPPGVQLAELW
jgi:hypothetical protein